MLDFANDIDFKSLVFGAAISAAIVIVASNGNDWLYLFSSIGLLYVGYSAKNIKYGAVLGAIASTPLIILAFRGDFGPLTDFYATDMGILTITLSFLLIGAVIGVVGAWAKSSREKAKVEYEKEQKSKKNKKDKKIKKSTTKNLPK